MNSNQVKGAARRGAVVPLAIGRITSPPEVSGHDSPGRKPSRVYVTAQSEYCIIHTCVCIYHLGGFCGICECGACLLVGYCLMDSSIPCRLEPYRRLSLFACRSLFVNCLLDQFKSIISPGPTPRSPPAQQESAPQASRIRQ